MQLPRTRQRTPQSSGTEEWSDEGESGPRCEEGRGEYSPDDKMSEKALAGSDTDNETVSGKYGTQNRESAEEEIWNQLHHGLVSCREKSSLGLDIARDLRSLKSSITRLEKMAGETSRDRYTSGMHGQHKTARDASRIQPIVPDDHNGKAHSHAPVYFGQNMTFYGKSNSKMEKKVSEQKSIETVTVNGSEWDKSKPDRRRHKYCNYGTGGQTNCINKGTGVQTVTVNGSSGSGAPTRCSKSQTIYHELRRRITRRLVTSVTEYLI